MTTFLTVKEASQSTGKSPSSIRRAIYPIIRDGAHPDRHHIQPTVDEVPQLRMKGENFAWRLSDELLRREFPAVAAQTKTTDGGTTPQTSQANAELVAMLRAELDIKNRQIDQAMELINGLSERLREGNVLFGSLQQRLTLTDGRGGNAPIAAKPKSAPSPQPEKRHSIVRKTAKPKRGFLSRLFR